MGCGGVEGTYSYGEISREPSSKKLNQGQEKYKETKEPQQMQQRKKIMNNADTNQKSGYNKYDSQQQQGPLFAGKSNEPIAIAVYGSEEAIGKVNYDDNEFVNALFPTSDSHGNRSSTASLQMQAQNSVIYQQASGNQIDEKKALEMMNELSCIHVSVTDRDSMIKHEGEKIEGP